MAEWQARHTAVDDISPASPYYLGGDEPDDGRDDELIDYFLINMEP